VYLKGKKINKHFLEKLSTGTKKEIQRKNGDKKEVDIKILTCGLWLKSHIGSTKPQCTCGLPIPQIL